MFLAHTDENGDLVKKCKACEVLKPIDQYYKNTGNQASKDGYQPRCRPCTLQLYKEQNARRAKKRRQKSHKLTKLHVDWIKEQQGKLSTREVARAFSKRFFNMKISPSTVSRINSGKIHVEPGEGDTMSIYDLLEGASEFSGSVEEYIESTTKKIKF